MKLVTLLAFLCSCYCITSCRPEEISIAPSDAGSQNLYTIGHFCQDTSAISNTLVTILNGTHRLNTTCDIKNANNVTLKAEQGSKVVITCEDCGFRFLNVSQLKISDIEFRGCGAFWQVYEDHVIAALVFVNGSSLTLFNVKAIYTGISIKNVAGNVTLDSCEIANSSSTIIFYDHTEEVTFNLINSLLTYNGYPIWLDSKVQFHLFTQKQFFFIVNTTYTDNDSTMQFYLNPSTTSDSFSCDKSKQSAANASKILSIIDSKFVNTLGGGLDIFWPPHSDGEESVLIDIVNTTFIYNQNNNFFGAAALKLARMLFYYVYEQTLKSKFELTVTISGCIFVNNSAASVPETGVIEAEGVSQIRLDNVIIESNSCSGILARETVLVFSGSTTIANNHALVGGGLHLVNIHSIMLASNTDLIITGNSAQNTGGGIQVDSTCSISNNPCLGLCNVLTDSSQNFSVYNNHAQEGGDNIFGKILCGNCYSGISSNSKSLNSSITTKPGSVIIDGRRCVFEYLNCSKLAALYPGQRIVYQMILHGFSDAINEDQGVVSGSVMATVRGASIQELEKIQRVSMSGSNITYTLYYFRKSRATLAIQPTEQYCSASSIIHVSITFYSCPLGFNLVKANQNGFACHCSNNISTVSNCSIQTQTITKRKDSWLGKYGLNNHSYLATSDYCPYDYCKSSFQNIKSDNFTLHQDDQCQCNRTGILCGSCPEGWSLVLGSSECREECSNVWLLLILPFALAGLLLVAAIHFLNLTVTMGTLSGLIFYANVIQQYSATMLYKYPIPGLTSILLVFLSWLNLDLGISTCFYHGMEAFGKTILLLVFPVYIWLISATIVALSNRYFVFTKMVGENSVKVLSTLFLLSYSKIFHAAIDCLKMNTVHVYFNNSASSEMRWAVDGNIPYFDPQRHLALFVIALFFIFLLLPFTMSLLCIRHVYSLSNCCRVFSCVDKLKPFFDTYTGPFKDRARFWTGLLLLVRLFLIIVASMNYSDDVIPYYIIVTVCFLLSTIMNFLDGVYKIKCLSNLEHFFILNIGVIFLVNSYRGGHELWKSIFTHFLLSLAFIAFIGIIAYHIYLKVFPFCKKRFQLRSQNADIDEDSLSYEGMRGYQPVQQDLDLFTQ